jgi:hypothetical protein
VAPGDPRVVHHDVGLRAATDHRDRPGQQVALPVDVDQRPNL